MYGSPLFLTYQFAKGFKGAPMRGKHAAAVRAQPRTCPAWESYARYSASCTFTRCSSGRYPSSGSKRRHRYASVISSARSVW